MREQFITKRFNGASREMIDRANVILAEYQAQGLVLTLRQLYYQFVARDFIPNKQSEYKRLGSVISDARLAGLIDWEMMEDRTRQVHKVNTWVDPSNIVSACAQQYREDLWRTQECRPEVWIEKDALLGVIEGACNDWRVPHFACRGYASQSSQYEAGLRFRRTREAGQKSVVLHFGDHDPGGMDMTRDNRERLAMFTSEGVEVIRLALNMDQVQRYKPPPNPAKETDIRFAGYVAEYGAKSWELDALEPSVIDQLIRSAITRMLDIEAWNNALRQEQDNHALLQAVADRWDDVTEFVG